jgi:hypothetical protein
MTISVYSTIAPSTNSYLVPDTDGSNLPSSIVANKLVDTESDFTNVSVGDVVVLIDSPDTYASVTAVDSNTELSLDRDIIKSLTDAYYVLPEANAFKVVLDGTQDYNLDVLCSPGDLVDTNSTEEVDATLSGCRVVSVDGPNQLTVDMPMGGYESVIIGLQKQPNQLDVGLIDIIFMNDGELLLTSYEGSFASNYAGLYAYGSGGAAIERVIIEDVEDAIVEAVGGGYRTNAPINQRALGAQNFDV